MNIIKKLTKFVRKIFFFFLSPRQIHSILYFLAHKNTTFPIMNWNNPGTHDEKIHWLIVNRYRNPDFGLYADKVRVREYVKECGFEDLLIPIYEVHDNINDFDLSKVPNSFVLKTNHGSGPMFYEFIQDKNDKSHLDYASKKMEKALKTDFYQQNIEYHYHYIKPLVYAEQLLLDGHERLNDYKVYVFKGKAKFIMVCTERTTKDKRVNFYDTDWNELDFVRNDHHGNGADKPQSLEYMLKAAEKLGGPFAIARIDFYEVEGKPYFGEITLTPDSGNVTYLTDDAQIKIGEMIDLKITDFPSQKNIEK
ncbi:hypothetical protein J5681_09160 [bacterium]|nr:hypothetical protein [bacterium]